MVKVIFDSIGKRAVAYDEDQEVGESTLSPSEKLWIIDHTFVDPAYKGQSIGQKMILAIVLEARALNKKIMPLCPFAASEFRKNPSYEDVLN